jgi:MSHA pilin protein MshA
MSLVQGNPATITMEGQVINMINGYPTNADIELTLTDYTGFTLAAGPPISFAPTGAAATADCQVTYAQAGAGGTPTIVVSSGTCN